MLPMMTSDIDVVIYSYKGKLIKDVISSLMTNSTGKRKINIILVDQHPLNRVKVFSEFSNLYYNHVFWDFQTSPTLYKKDILERSNAKYILILGDNVLLSKDWDDTLTNFVDLNDGVVSGNQKVFISQEPVFYLKKIYSESDNFSLTNLIDRDFIFFNRDKVSNINYPVYLKYNGEEEALSLNIFTSGINIYCSPTSTFSKVGVSTLEELYIPFSVNHNYNQVVRLFKSELNDFVNLSSQPRSVKDFCSFHGIEADRVNFLPFQTNDVEYDPGDMNFNSVDARRFVARTKAIH